MVLHMDNKGAIDMAHANGPSKRTKHIEVQQHFIQQLIGRCSHDSPRPVRLEAGRLLTKLFKRLLLQQACAAHHLTTQSAIGRVVPQTKQHIRRCSRDCGTKDNMTQCRLVPTPFQYLYHSSPPPPSRKSKFGTLTNFKILVHVYTAHWNHYAYA